jgi:hypothetical protein
MTQPYVFCCDTQANCASLALGFQIYGAKAYWIRYESYRFEHFLSTIMDRLASINLYACLIDNQSTVHLNERMSDFLGAFGGNKLLALNKEKSYRKTMRNNGKATYIDFCRVTQRSMLDIKNFWLTGFTGKCSFFLSSGKEIDDEKMVIAADSLSSGTGVQQIVQELIDEQNLFFGFFVEDTLTTRSLVFVSKEIFVFERAFSVTGVTEISEAEMFESMTVYSDRLANRSAIEGFLARRDGERGKTSA